MAQLFINYYILQGASDVSTDLFGQDFWYRVCRVIYGRLTMEALQQCYPRLYHLQTIYTELIQTTVLSIVSLSEIHFSVPFFKPQNFYPQAQRIFLDTSFII